MRLSLFFSLAVKTSAMISSFLCPTSVSGAFSSSLSPHRHSWSQCMWPIGTIEIRRGSYRCVCWATIPFFHVLFNLVLSYCLVYLLMSHFILFCHVLYYITPSCGDRVLVELDSSATKARTESWRP